jgi:hypothetical protein
MAERVSKRKSMRTGPLSSKPTLTGPERVRPMDEMTARPKATMAANEAFLAKRRPMGFETRSGMRPKS